MLNADRVTKLTSAAALLVILMATTARSQCDPEESHVWEPYGLPYMLYHSLDSGPSQCCVSTESAPTGGYFEHYSGPTSSDVSDICAQYDSFQSCVDIDLSAGSGDTTIEIVFGELPNSLDEITFGLTSVSSTEEMQRGSTYPEYLWNATYDAITCAIITIQTNMQIVSGDRVYRYHWCDGDCPTGAGPTEICQEPPYTSNGIMYLNRYEHLWVTLAHELGHAMGMDHNVCATSIMCDDDGLTYLADYDFYTFGPEKILTGTDADSGPDRALGDGGVGPG